MTVKRAIFKKHGVPEEVIEIVEEPDPLPGPGEVRVRNQIMTINPADLLTIEGRYGAEPVDLPYTPGFGAYGVVDALGDGVTRLATGDAVLPLGGSLWSDTVIVHERMAPKAPDGVDEAQAAMMRANPATAYLMLQDIVDLAPGDWVIQNAANSSVGRLLIRFAREFGYRTVNIVRREGLRDLLEGDGADVVLVDDGQTDIVTAVRAATGGEAKLAIDAVGGEASHNLAAALENGGMLVVYGLLSGIDSRIGARELVFRDIKVAGFWLAHWFATASLDDMRSVNEFLVAKIRAGLIHSDVEAIYPLDQIAEAVTHAGQAGRSGKVLLKGNVDA